MKILAVALLIVNIIAAVLNALPLATTSTNIAALSVFGVNVFAVGWLAAFLVWG